MLQSRRGEKHSAIPKESQLSSAERGQAPGAALNTEAEFREALKDPKLLILCPAAPWDEGELQDSKKMLWRGSTVMLREGEAP